jgi:hypothetical protein
MAGVLTMEDKTASSPGDHVLDQSPRKGDAAVALKYGSSRRQQLDPTWWRIRESDLLQHVQRSAVNAANVCVKQRQIPAALHARPDRAHLRRKACRSRGGTGLSPQSAYGRHSGTSCIQISADGMIE